VRSKSATAIGPVRDRTREDREAVRANDGRSPVPQLSHNHDAAAENRRGSPPAAAKPSMPRSPPPQLLQPSCSGGDDSGGLLGDGAAPVLSESARPTRRALGVDANLQSLLSGCSAALPRPVLASRNGGRATRAVAAAAHRIGSPGPLAALLSISVLSCGVGDLYSFVHAAAALSDDLLLALFDELGVELVGEGVGAGAGGSTEAAAASVGRGSSFGSSSAGGGAPSPPPPPLPPLGGSKSLGASHGDAVSPSSSSSSSPKRPPPKRKHAIAVKRAPMKAASPKF